MLTLVAVAVAVIVGAAVGWALRSVTQWCPHCGATLMCSDCGSRPGLASLWRHHPRPGQELRW